MGRVNFQKLEHRDQLRDLFREIQKRLSNALMKDVADELGIPASQVSRILAQGVASPTYVDTTKFIVRAGLTPNEGAALAGLYPPTDEEQQFDPDVWRAIQLLNDPALDQEARERVLVILETYVQAERLRNRAQPRFSNSKPIGEIEPGSRRTPSRAKTTAAS